MPELFKVQNLGVKQFTDRGKHLVLQFLQEYFGQMDEYRWQADEKATEIMIVDKNSTELSSVEKHPILATSRGSMRWLRRTIDQFKGGFTSSGTDKFMDLMNSTVVVGCYAKNGLVAEELASIVFGGFTFFRRVLRARGVHEITALELGEEQIVRIDAEQDASLVPVTVAFSYSESWTLTPRGPLLRDIKDPATIS